MFGLVDQDSKSEVFASEEFFGSGTIRYVRKLSEEATGKVHSLKMPAHILDAAGVEEPVTALGSGVR